jgi:hypothetical protein
LKTWAYFEQKVVWRHTPFDTFWRLRTLAE